MGRKEEQTNLFCENDFFTTWDAHPTIEYNFKSHRKEMSSSDEEIPKCERQSAEYEPHSCEPIDLLIRATHYVSSHSGEPSISSLPVSEGSPSVRQPVEPSFLSDPESHPDYSSNNCNQKMTQGTSGWHILSLIVSCFFDPAVKKSNSFLVNALGKKALDEQRFLKIVFERFQEMCS
ncbi:hypothetical protein NPIL_324271 [Nephila pilipes]|uniref:Uncharacterized protein n=1 Tax=Nephila pilipes TaxID=299642 RepID=A0A8X6TX20_NEPPI|nr:hypothetical protein NPIL_324271 [Nephila pilipes]